MCSYLIWSPKIKCVLPPLPIAAKIPFSDLKNWTFLTQSKMDQKQSLVSPQAGWSCCQHQERAGERCHRPQHLAQSCTMIWLQVMEKNQPRQIRHDSALHKHNPSQNHRPLISPFHPQKAPDTSVSCKQDALGQCLQQIWSPTGGMAQSMFVEDVIPWFFMQPLHVTHPGRVTPALPHQHIHTARAGEIKEGKPWARGLGVGGQSQHGLHFNCQASLWMEHLDLGLPSHQKVTLPHISSPSLKSLSHSLLLPTLLKWLFCSFRLNLNTKAAIPAPHWSNSRSFLHTTDTHQCSAWPALPTRIIYRHSSRSDSTLDIYHCLSNTQTTKITPSNHPCSLPKR